LIRRKNMRNEAPIPFHITDKEAIEACGKKDGDCRYGPLWDHFPSTEAAEAYLAYTTVDQKRLRKFARSHYMEVRRGVAANPATSTDILKGLMHDSASWVQLHVSENPNTTPEMLVAMAMDEEVSIRAKESIASNRKTPVDVLLVLSFHSDGDVRANMAGNPNTPIEELGRLSLDRDSRVRARVAGNRNTPYEFLEALADDFASVREELFERAHFLPFEQRVMLDVLMAVRQDEDELADFLDSQLSNFPPGALETPVTDSPEEAL
jgi:hypothetical protein